MKKILVLLAFVLMASIMTACGKDETVKKNKEIVNVTFDEKEDDTVSDNTGISVAEEVDYLFPAVVINDKVISIGDEFDSSFSAYDDKVEISTFENKAKQFCYLYGGIAIYTCVEDREKVYLIEIADGELLSGIAVGDNKDKLDEVYGTELKEDSLLEEIIADELHGNSSEENIGSLSENIVTDNQETASVNSVSDNETASVNNVSDNETASENAINNGTVEQLNIVYFKFEKENVIVIFELTDNVITYMELAINS